MEKEQKIELIERYVKIDGKKICDGDFVKFNYGKKGLEFGGYFYLADLPNQVFWADFLISEKKKEEWKWYDGYLKGFRFDLIKNFEIVKQEVSGNSSQS